MLYQFVGVRRFELPTTRPPDAYSNLYYKLDNQLTIFFLYPLVDVTVDFERSNLVKQ